MDEALQRVEKALRDAECESAHEFAAMIGIVGLQAARDLLEEVMPRKVPGTWKYDDWSGWKARNAFYKDLLSIAKTEQSMIATAATHLDKAATQRRHKKGREEKSKKNNSAEVQKERQDRLKNWQKLKTERAQRLAEKTV